MRKQKDASIDMLQGMLDLLILRTLLCRARNYRLTAAGCNRLTTETNKWE